MRRVPILFAALITMGTAANATTLAAGGIFGGTTQNTATCRLFNSGASAVSILTRQIIREGTGPLPLTFNFCGGALAAGAICTIQVNSIGNAVSHACKFVINQSINKSTFMRRI